MAANTLVRYPCGSMPFSLHVSIMEARIAQFGEIVTQNTGFVVDVAKDDCCGHFQISFQEPTVGADSVMPYVRAIAPESGHSLSATGTHRRPFTIRRALIRGQLRVPLHGPL